MASGIHLKPVDAPNTSYHVTAHAVGDLKIFRCRQDMREFLGRFRNYLSPKPYKDASRHEYTKLHDDVALLAYCLMENHFHLVLHQFSSDGMSSLMRRTLTGYGMYFNKRYGRRGPILDARYAAKPILDADHAKHALAYVHLNEPVQQLDYEFSSHKLMLGESSWDWIDTQRALAIFGGVDTYKAFLDRRGPQLVADKLIERGLDPAKHPYRPINRPTAAATGSARSPQPRSPERTK